MCINVYFCKLLILLHFIHIIHIIHYILNSLYARKHHSYNMPMTHILYFPIRFRQKMRKCVFFVFFSLFSASYKIHNVYKCV